MKESIEQLENILMKVFIDIEKRIRIEESDLNYIDSLMKDKMFEDKIDIQDKFLQHRELIVKYKGDKSFWQKEIPNLISLLENSKERIQKYRKDLFEIGGKNLPNEDIVQLLEQKILTKETHITKTYKGEKYIGHLTSDGYLELVVSGVKKKLSLRQAALFACGADPSNQWTFWEVSDGGATNYSLEHYRKLLDKF